MKYVMKGSCLGLTGIGHQEKAHKITLLFTHEAAMPCTLLLTLTVYLIEDVLLDNYLLCTEQTYCCPKYD